MARLTERLFANERLRHAAMAIVVAAIVSFVTILRPLDISLWAIQSKLLSKAPSGQIVLVTDRSQQRDASQTSLNRTLLDAINRLENAEAQLIVIGSALQRSGSSETDEELRQALKQNNEQIFLTRPIRADIKQNKQVDVGSPFFENEMRIASSDIRPDFLGFVWEIDATHGDGETDYPSAWNAIGAGARANTAIYPDYTIDAAQLPQVELADLANGTPAALQAVSNKTVVIWGLGHDRRVLKAPNANYVSAGVIQVIAAETAMRGTGQIIGSWLTIPAFGLILLIGLSLVRTRRQRLSLYVFWLLAFAFAFAFGPMAGIRVMLSDALFLGAFYAIMRAIYNYRRNQIYIDQRSRLPNFSAMRRDLECLNNSEMFVIVVAKIARLDAVLATLSQYGQRQYLRQIAARLKLGEVKQTVYHDGGRNFSFLLPAADYPDLKSHLESLRTVASQAVVVSKRMVDVSMTIGVDHSSKRSVAGRISSAVAAADQAREAYRPVFIITNFEADSENWDYSLQSRLEGALTDNRIWIKLQPLIELQSGIITGAEALARWVDEERGEIPPAHFIPQCERVGRLDELTRRVLSLSFGASRSLQEQGLPPRVSVNVSAIQFVDHRIADMVEESLTESKAKPANIIIEITESVRIDNFSEARQIMERIGKLGIQFSIDDFGISSANFDALYNLPFSELKVDRMFVSAMANERTARTIVENMLGLSRELGLVSVAEGIEDLATLEMLRDMGGDLGQGYFIARPQTLPALQEIMRLQRDNEIRRRC